jgi:O-antigen/teichoic acid export membrane protein
MADVSLRRLVARNTGILGLSQAAVMLIGFATTVVLSRYLGVEGFGRYSYVFAFFYFFLAVNDFGITTTVVREVSRQRERAADIIGGLLSLRVLLAAGSTVVAWVIIDQAGFAPELQHALEAFALILPITALQLPLTIFPALLRPGLPSAAGIGARLAGLLMVLGLVWLRAGLVALVVAYLVAELGYVVVALGFARRLVRLTCRIDVRLWTTTLRSAAVIGLTNLAVALINRLDFLMLERMKGLADVGLYAAAYRVTNTFETLPLLVMGSIYPLLSRYAEDPSRLRRVYWESLRYLAVLGLAAGAAVTWLAPVLVRLLFGAEFLPAIPALRILIWSSVAVCAFLTSTNLLISLRRERSLLVVYVLAAGVNFALNLTFIPSFGINGAAAATVASYAFVLVAATALAVAAVSGPGTAAVAALADRGGAGGR